MRGALAIFLWCLALIGLSQNQLQNEIDISFQDMELKQAIHQLQTKTNLKFSYNPDAIPTRHVVSASFSGRALGSILNELMGEGFEYKLRGSYLIIQRRYKKKTDTKKNLTVSGKVTDSSTGESLSGVSVYEVNELTAALSESDGSYELTAPVLQPFTYLAIAKENYQDTVIRISNLQTTPIEVALIPLQSPKNSEAQSAHRVFGKFRNKELKAHEKNVQLYEERLVQLSLLPIAGTNGRLGGKIANKYSLNLVAGFSHSLRGVEIGGALNMERKDAKGVQIAGVSNIVGDRMKGVQIAGATNSNTNSTSGLTMAGAVNTSGSLKGVQLAGASNINFNEAKGLMLSGATNSSGSLKGVQVAGAYNYTKHKVEGLQLSGGINHAGELLGVQIGIVNIAKKAKNGLMIGIVNISKDGLLRFEIEHNDLTTYNLAFKSGTYTFYSIFTAGFSPHGNNRLWSYGMGFGSQQFFNQKLYSALELTTNTFLPLERYITGLSVDNRLSISMGVQQWKHLSLDAGPIIHYALFQNKKDQNQEFFEKIGHFHFVDKPKQKLWLGYRLGVRF